ncbi:MAG: acyltransferase [Methylibium sp.]|nr:acyltransferase [Methylibium sp.]
MIPGYLHGIDSLRAIAVIGVVIFHLDPSLLTSGFTGVDIFFVISGYVVAGSLMRERPESFGRFALTFYARRLVRLYPALVFCLLGSILAAALFIPASWLSTSTWQVGLLAFAGLGNMGLLLLSDGYFSPRAEFNPFTHTWSLGVEEQFYLLFPLLAYGWLAYRKRASGLAVLGLTAASLLYCIWATTAQPDWAFYTLASRWWELSAGVLLLILHRRGRCLPRSAGMQWANLLAGVALMGAALTLRGEANFPWPWSLSAVAGVMLCLCAIASLPAKENRGLRALVETRALTYVGRMSYSLYLWHWPVFVLARWTVGLESVECRLAAVLLALLMAMFSYHWVEAPTRLRWQRRAPGAGRTLVWGWLAVGIAVAAAVLVVQSRYALSLSRVVQERHDWYPDARQAGTPADLAARMDSPLNGLRLWVIGDSHAGAYAPLFQRLRDEDGVEVRVLWRADCAMAKRQSLMPKDCAAFLESAQSRVLSKAQAGDVLFLPGLRVARIADQGSKENLDAAIDDELAPGARQERIEAGAAAKALAVLAQARGLELLYEAPKPVLRAPPFRCSDWFNHMNPSCSAGTSIPRAALDPLLAPTRAALDALAASPGARATVWNPFETLCPGAVCAAFSPSGKPLFFDADHISAYSNDLLYPSFKAMLMQLVQRHRAARQSGS